MPSIGAHRVVEPEPPAKRAKPSPPRARLRTKMRGIVEAAIDSRMKRLLLVWSPDLDGEAACALIAIYVQQTHPSIAVHKIGTYNSLRLAKPHDGWTADDLTNALWVDLDVNFKGVKYCIGQHLLGHAERTNSPHYFNIHFEFEFDFDPPTSSSNKCPFSTTHLVLWLLFENEEDVPSLKETNTNPAARAVVAHADSLYAIALTYPDNVERWADRLFGTDVKAWPTTLRMLCSGTYFAEMATAHHALLTELAAIGNGDECYALDVPRGDSRWDGTRKNPPIFDVDELLDPAWDWTMSNNGKRFLKHQSIQETPWAKDLDRHFRTTQALAAVVQRALDPTHSAPLTLTLDAPAVHWSGTFLKMKRGEIQYSPTTPLSSLLPAKHNGRIMSHAWIFDNKCSATLGKDWSII